jgi:hypothetical protein
MRIAEYLFRWTGDVKYADFYEKNIYNGLLAQGHYHGRLTSHDEKTLPKDGRVSYFLPLAAGSKNEGVKACAIFAVIEFSSLLSVAKNTLRSKPPTKDSFQNLVILSFFANSSKPTSARSIVSKLEFIYYINPAPIITEVLMKKILLGILLLTIFANSAITQKSIVGNWTLAQLRTADPNAIVSLENDTLNIMEKDWKFTEVIIYNVNYPGYGAKKINLKYKLRISLEGDYRIESDALKKYYKGFESEILEGASDAEAAQTSLKEIEKMVKDELRTAAPILHASETEMELQGINANPNLKYAKPKMLPASKLTSKQVPFFAPEGWRYPESAKELANFPVRLKNDKNLLTIVEADFNGDGLQDAVAYLMNDQTGQIALFLNLSQPDGSYSLEPYG